MSLMKGMEFDKGLLQKRRTTLVPAGKEVAGESDAVGNGEAPTIGAAHNSSSWKGRCACRCLPLITWV